MKYQKCETKLRIGNVHVHLKNEVSVEALKTYKILFELTIILYKIEVPRFYTEQDGKTG